MNGGKIKIFFISFAEHNDVHEQCNKNIIDPHQKPLQRDIGILLFLEIKNGFNGGRPERKILVLCSVIKRKKN